MNVRDFYNGMCKIIPGSLSCEWDNDGLSCCPDPEREVGKVLISLDPTLDAIKYAGDNGFDVLLTHHPILFHPLSAANDDTVEGKRIVSLFHYGVSAMAFHTRFDALTGGVNDTLAELLGLKNIRPFGADAIGRIGELEKELSLEEFAAAVKQKLNAPAVIFAGKETVKHVALLGGAGADDAEDAFEAGADTYVTGELKYHQLSEAPERGKNYIMAGHFFTENPSLEKLSEFVLSLDPKIKVEFYFSSTVKAI